jgi:hypothetical protein
VQRNQIWNLNYWVMHPVARVSIKYWKNLRTQQSISSARSHCALLTLHVSAPFSLHLQVVRKHKKYPRQSLYIQRIRICCLNAIFIYYITTIFTYTYLLNGSVEYIVPASDIFCVCKPPEDGS